MLELRELIADHFVVTIFVIATVSSDALYRAMSISACGHP